MEQRFTFNQVASLYDASRPDYPDALFGDIISAAALGKGDAILEVGCGTGKATIGLARHGFPLLATDPGPDMIRVARGNLEEFPNVSFMQTTFEAWPLQPAAFGLIVAAQSWHWVDPAVRFVKAAQALTPNGILALFGNVPVGLTPPLVDEFRDIYARRSLPFGVPPEAGYLPSGPFKRWFDESGRFAPTIHKSYAWRRAHDGASYTDWLRTRSDHRLIPAAQLEGVLQDVANAIAARGNRCELLYETHLYMGRFIAD